jgi:hypothetical protein
MNVPGISLCARTSDQSADLHRPERVTRQHDFRSEIANLVHFGLFSPILPKIGAFQKTDTV